MAAASPARRRPASRCWSARRRALLFFVLLLLLLLLFCVCERARPSLKKTRTKKHRTNQPVNAGALVEAVAAVDGQLVVERDDDAVADVGAQDQSAKPSISQDDGARKVAVGRVVADRRVDGVAHDAAADRIQLVRAPARRAEGAVICFLCVCVSESAYHQLHALPQTKNKTTKTNLATSLHAAVAQ